MAILVTVNIPHTLDKVTEVEQSNPDVMAIIGGAAQKHMTGHRRFAADGRVMDLDEFKDREDYDAFIVEAGDAIEQYGELLGAPAQDTIWTAIEEG